MGPRHAGMAELELDLSRFGTIDDVDFGSRQRRWLDQRQRWWSDRRPIAELSRHRGDHRLRVEVADRDNAGADRTDMALVEVFQNRPIEALQALLGTDPWLPVDSLVVEGGDECLATQDTGIALAA